MKTPKFFQQYPYTRSERLAVLGFTIMAVLIFLLPRLVAVWRSEHDGFANTPDTTWMAKVRIQYLEQNPENDTTFDNHPTNTPRKEVSYFRFDPNTATSEDFERLGLHKRVAQAILNYRAKGGRFRQAADFAKIYTLNKEDFNRLEPWIDIPDTPKNDLKPGQPASPHEFTTRSGPHGVDSVGSTNPEKEKYGPQKKANPVIIDVNQATVEQWQLLRGIGPTYAKRIVNFRDKLGGFAQVEQIGETWGLPDSVLQQIKPFLQISPIFRTIDLNHTSIQDLGAHPYIKFNQAKVVYNYVQLRTPFRDMNQLARDMADIFSKEEWERLLPYLRLND